MLLRTLSSQGLNISQRQSFHNLLPLFLHAGRCKGGDTWSHHQEELLHLELSLAEIRQELPDLM